MDIKRKLMKLCKVFIAGLLMFSGVLNNLSTVFAQTLEGEFQYGSDTGYYIVSKAGSHGSSSNGLNYKRVKRNGSSTWIPAFCMQPGVTLHNGDTIKPSEYTQKRLARLAFLGYYNQKNAKNYINTQALVYDEIGDTVSYVSTGNYTSFKKSVLDKYAKYSTKPKWNKDISVNAGSSVTFTDTNEVFEDYENFTIEKNGVTLSHTKGKNTLKVAVAKTCKVTTQKFSESELKKVGGYKWKSTSDVNVYYKNSDGQDIITFGEVDAVGFSLEVDINYSSLKISKEDENGKLIPQTSFLLSYNENMSSPIGTYTTGDNGTITIQSLVPGTVYVQETKVPDHLVLDKTIHKVTLTANKTASFKATNKIKKGKIIVTKKDDQNNKTVLQSGIEFEIYNKKTNEMVEKIITNDKGVATSKELVYGEYYVKEVKAPKGYQINVKKTDVNIVVDNNDYNIIVKNVKTPGKIIINKNGEVLTAYENGKFIYANKGLKGMEVQIIAEENIIDPADQSILYKKGDVVKTAVTGDDGKVSVDVPLGKYRIKEIKAPLGYVLSKEDKIISLTYLDPLASVVSDSVSFYNDRQKVNVQAMKKDSLTKEAIENAVIGLYAKKDIFNYEGKKIINKDTLLEKSISNKEGQLEFKTDLPLSTYYLKEVEAPMGYVKSEQVYDIDVTAKDQTTPVYKLSQVIENTPITIKITKQDITSSKEISGAKLEVIDKETKKVIDSWISDAKTPHYIYNLVKGKTYILKETLAPNGFVKANDIEFVVKGTSEVQSVIMKDEQAMGEINVFKKGEVLTGFKDGKFIYEVQGLANATFEIYAKDDIKNIVDGSLLYKAGTKVAIIVTNSDGYAKSGKLPLGVYEVKETKAPEGYVINSAIQTVELKYKDQNVSLIKEEVDFIDQRQSVDLTVIKKDDQTNQSLAGATFQLLNKNDIQNNKGEVIVKANTLLDTQVSNNEGKAYFRKDLPLGIYIVKEVKAPIGYSINNISIEFNAAYQGQNKQIVKLEQNFLNEPTKILISKIDITNSKEISGAKLSVTDTTNHQIIDTWISDASQPHYIEKLVVGRTYILTETKPADGYATAESIKFTVKDTGVVQKVEMKDDITKIDISKTDITNGKELEGAKLEVRDENNKIIDSWTSGKTPHRITKLVAGKSYTLNETKPADGYATAENVKFTVKDAGVVQKVEMKDDITKIDISKTDITNGKELEGAKLEVRDENNKVIDSWISGKTPHRITKLVVGKTYTLIETKPADGYATAENVKFTVKDAGVVQKVEMKDDITKIDISKTDITNGKELEGAKLEVRDENNKVIDSWTSGKTPHRIEKLIAGKTYTLIETKPADGYATAENVKFTVKDAGTVQKVEMKDDITKIDISKTDITSGKELEGAKLEVRDENNKVIDSWTSGKTPHRIEKLVVGKSYTLIETKPADGYTTTESIKFTIKDTGVVQKVEMKDDITKIEIKKLDVDGQSLAGAKLRIVEKDSNKTVYEFTSDENSRRIDAQLIVGKTYVLMEDEAPEGYVRAKDVEFKVLDTSDVQVIKMIDKIMYAQKIDVEKNNIAGATLQVVSMKTKNIIDQWVSDGLKHRINGLSVDEEYILREVKAPKGYVRAADMLFIVDDNYQDQYISMVDKKVTMNKTDITNGKELPGATISVIHKDTKKEIDRWVSTNEKHAINNLEENEVYILTEIIAPDGYSIAESIEFKVESMNEDGVKFDQHYEMKDEPILTDIQVNKIDSHSKELIKEKDFEFTLYTDKECLDEIMSLRSDPKRGTVTFEKLRYGTYFIKETSAPEGYYLSDEVKEVIISDDLKEAGNVFEIDYEDQPMLLTKTGDYQRLGIYVLGMIIPLSYFMIMNYRKKKVK